MPKPIRLREWDNPGSQTEIFREIEIRKWDMEHGAPEDGTLLVKGLAWGLLIAWLLSIIMPKIL